MLLTIIDSPSLMLILGEPNVGTRTAEPEVLSRPPIPPEEPSTEFELPKFSTVE
jgi:hypothetical protein